MDNFQFGRRINYWRTRRRLTRSEFAALMGKSLRWVKKLLEGGRRHADPQLSVCSWPRCGWASRWTGCWTTARSSE